MPRRPRGRRRPKVFEGRKPAPPLVVQACQILTAGRSRATTNAGVVQCLNQLDPWQLYEVIYRDETLLPEGMAAALARFIADRQEEITDLVALYAAKWFHGDLSSGGTELAEKLGFDHLANCDLTAILHLIVLEVRSSTAGREILEDFLARLRGKAMAPGSIETRVVAELMQLLSNNTVPSA